MRTIKESILGTTNSGKLEVNKKLTEKLWQKFNAAKNTVGDDFYDNLGQKLELGDIVVTINDALSFIGCITNMRDPEDKECMMVYIPHYKKEKSTFPFDVIKLSEPEKLLKL